MGDLILETPLSALRRAGLLYREGGFSTPPPSSRCFYCLIPRFFPSPIERALSSQQELRQLLLLHTVSRFFLGGSFVYEQRRFCTLCFKKREKEAARLFIYGYCFRTYCILTERRYLPRRARRLIFCLPRSGGGLHP